jgi:hypothetical protein
MAGREGKMRSAERFGRLLTACLLAEWPISDASAQENSILGTWRTMIGTPSTYGQPSSSVVFTTTFAGDGSYRTIAVVEGGNGYQGVGGTYIMTGHYEFRPPSSLRYRLENSVLCVAVNVCSPGVPPGQQPGAVVSVELQFKGAGGFIASGQAWTRVQ